jgi:hypothetical protein
VGLLAAALAVWVVGVVVTPGAYRRALLDVGIIGWGVLLLWAILLNLPRYLRRRRHHPDPVESSRFGEWWEQQ